jgi:hypothetical protein
MIPKREEFILDVRRAARLEQRPTAATDSDLINPDALAKVLHRAALWLTPKTVEAYAPAEFMAWDEGLQKELQAAVERFRAVAQAVPPDKPASAEQFRGGLEAFQRLLSAVRSVVLSEWISAVAGVTRQIEQWSADRGWPTRRQEKQLTETLLGQYSLPQLYLHADGNLYILDPLARFVPGALGAFDLSIQPSFYVTSLYRHFDGTWYVHLNVGQGVNGAENESLTSESFAKAVHELRSLV